MVVYPEEEDVGKPKMFARQSFIVSGEEEEMAETILKARQLGERERASERETRACTTIRVQFNVETHYKQPL